MFKKISLLLVCFLMSATVFAVEFLDAEVPNDPLLAYKDIVPTQKTELFRVYLKVDATTISLLPTEEAVEQGIKAELLEFVLHYGRLYVHYVSDGQCVGFTRSKTGEVTLLTDISTYDEKNDNLVFCTEVQPFFKFADEIIMKDKDGERIAGINGGLLTEKQINQVNAFFRKSLDDFGLSRKDEHYASLSEKLDISMYRRIKASHLKLIIIELAEKYNMHPENVAKGISVWAEFYGKYELNDNSMIYSRIVRVSVGWHGDNIYHQMIWVSKADLKKAFTLRDWKGYQYPIKTARPQSR